MATKSLTISVNFLYSNLLYQKIIITRQKAKSKPKLHISSDDENFAHINFNKSGEKNGWGLVWFRVTRFFIVSEKCGFEQNLHDCESFWRSCIFVFKMLWNMKLWIFSNRELFFLSLWGYSLSAWPYMYFKYLSYTLWASLL